MPSNPSSSWNNKWWAKKEFRVFINDQIRANSIMVIDADWENVGTFYRDKALALAQDQWLDLIQLNYNPQSMVSTCTIQDYGRYQYQKKKLQNEKRKTQAKGMKELQVWYTISDNDLELKMNKARELVQEGYSVRFVIKLKGREMIFKSKARERIQYIVNGLEDLTRSQYIKEEPRWYSVILSPKSSNWR